MIKLHNEHGALLIVMVAHIVYFEPHPYGGTMISLDDQTRVLVKESFTKVETEVNLWTRLPVVP